MTLPCDALFDSRQIGWALNDGMQAIRVGQPKLQMALSKCALS